MDKKLTMVWRSNRVEYGKPAGTTLGTYSTYEEAQKKYEAVKAEHGGNYIYMGTTQTK